MSSFLETEAAIRQLHSLYTDAVWRKDIEAFGACFARDAQWRVSGAIVEGRKDIADFMAAAFEKYRRILLTFRTPIVQISDTEISARTYVSEQSVLTSGQPYGPIGTYYERFIEEEGRLRFSWRLFMTEYVGPPDLSGEFFDNPDFGAPPNMPSVDQQSFNRSGILKAKTD